MKDKEKQIENYPYYVSKENEEVFNKTAEKAVITNDMIKDCLETHQKLNKEKQIEEMAKLIDDRLVEARGYLGSMNKGQGYWIAQKLIKHYQPKLPEDSVVLSKEEKDKTDKYITELCSMIDNLKDDLKQTSKETAERIITKIKQSLNSVETIVGDTHKLQPEIGYSMREVDDLLDELAKLPEHSVMLSGKQCVEIVQDNYNIGYKRGSKETAEKILLPLLSIMALNIDTLKELENTICLFAKQFDVEIKE